MERKVRAGLIKQGEYGITKREQWCIGVQPQKVLVCNLYFIILETVIEQKKGRKIGEKGKIQCI